MTGNNIIKGLNRETEIILGPDIFACLYNGRIHFGLKLTRDLSQEVKKFLLPINIVLAAVGLQFSDAFQGIFLVIFTKLR